MGIGEEKYEVQLGIGIAAGVAVLIVVVFAIFFWRRRRRAGRYRGVSIPAPINIGAGGKYSPTNDKNDVWPGHQSYEPMTQQYEMGSQPQHTHHRDPYV